MHFHHHYNYFWIDGETPMKNRQRSVDSFNDLKNYCRLFLISTRAGCLGITLTAATRVIARRIHPLALFMEESTSDLLEKFVVSMEERNNIGNSGKLVWLVKIFRQCKINREKVLVLPANLNTDEKSTAFSWFVQRFEKWLSSFSYINQSRLFGYHCCYSWSLFSMCASIPLMMSKASIAFTCSSSFCCWMLTSILICIFPQGSDKTSLVLYIVL